MDFDRAEIIGINALSFIASDEKHLSGYLRLTGMDIDTLRSDMTNQHKIKTILTSILDYMMQNEKCLLEYAETYELDPEDIVKSRDILPGAMPFQS